MKKENKSSKKTKTMESTSVPKRMQPLMEAITDFVIGIHGNISPTDSESEIREEMTNHQEELLQLLKKHMPSQKTAPLKKVKDPEAPKRGKSSYIYFCVEKRPVIKNANPDMSAKEIIKELGRVWREDTSEADKARYAKMSADDNSRYTDEMKDYVPPPNVGTVIEKKAKRSGPKRSLTSYIFFCKDQRAILKEEEPNLSTKDVTAALGKRWKALSEKDRKPYEKLAAKDKARYEKDKASWVEPEEDSVDKPVTKKGKSTKKAVKSDKGKASDKNPAAKRKKSGYILFCQDERNRIKEEHGDWTSQQVTKELGRRWKELSPDEQAAVNERAENASEDSEAPVEKKAPKGSKGSKGKVKGKGKGKGKKSKGKKPEPEPESDLDELVDEESE